MIFLSVPSKGELRDLILIPGIFFFLTRGCILFLHKTKKCTSAVTSTDRPTLNFAKMRDNRFVGVVSGCVLSGFVKACGFIKHVHEANDAPPVRGRPPAARQDRVKIGITRGGDFRMVHVCVKGVP